MKNEILKNDKIENLGYVIDVKYYENYVTGQCFNCNGKEPKSVFAYRFKDEKNLLDYVIEFFKKIQNRIDEKNRDNQIKKEAIENFVNPYKVGDVLYDSWGYEQTNIDFYQVVEIKNKSIVIREIHGELTGESHGPDSGYVRPLVDSFKSEPMIKKINIRVWDGKVNHSIKSPHRGGLSIYDRGEKGLYSSWYY